MAKKLSKKTNESLKHEDDKRKNVPTAEFQSVLKPGEQKPIEGRVEKSFSGMIEKHANHVAERGR